MMLYVKYTNYLKNSSLRDIFLQIFLYITFCAILIQFVILPIFLSHSHWGGGFLNNRDAITYHRISSEVAENINKEGLSAWSIKPRSTHHELYGISSGINGVVSLIYSYTGPNLWAIIPFNAVVHSLSAIILINIFMLLGAGKATAVFSSMPFIFFPSSAQWWAQIGKDGVFILGFFLLIYSILYGVQAKNNKTFFLAIAGVALGMFSIWLMREYIVIIAMLLTSLLIIFWAIYSYAFNKVFNYAFVISYLFLNGMSIHTNLYDLNSIVEFKEQINEQRKEQAKEHINEQAKEHINEQAKEHINEQKQELDQSNPLKHSAVLDEYEGVDESMNQPDGVRVGESSNNFLYSSMVIVKDKIQSVLLSIEKKMIRKINGYRDNFEAIKTVSSLDYTKRYSSIGDVILYLPRALQIGLFAPFPDQWLKSGSSRANTIMRKVAIFEMSIFYISFMFLLANVTKLMKNPAVVFVLLLSVGMILIQTYSVTNIGTLYRMRFLFHIIICGIGVFAFVEYFINKK